METNPKKPADHLAQVTRRRAALAELKASFALDGVELDAADLEALEPYIRGEISLDEFIWMQRLELHTVKG